MARLIRQLRERNFLFIFINQNFRIDYNKMEDLSSQFANFVKDVSFKLEKN